MKDCTFQYAASDGVIFEEKGLISRADAEELWQAYIPKFKQHLKEGREPEMAIWIDMENDEDFHVTSSHWVGEEMFFENGSMYRKEFIA